VCMRVCVCMCVCMCVCVCVCVVRPSVRRPYAPLRIAGTGNAAAE